MKTLNAEQIANYREHGYVFPVQAFSESEMAQLRDSLERLEESQGGIFPARLNKKPHLLLTWLNQLVRHPRILDAVEDILGPDLLCWGSGFFIKNAYDPAKVTWHQDSTYWGLSKPDIVTAWVAFTPSTQENGCMRVIPGTHFSDQLPHRDTFAKNNLLSRGQEVAVDVDPSKAVDVVLAPGEFSLHHVRLVHGSEPNRSASRRVGFAIRYLPTYVRQLSGVPDSATLVRGTDKYSHFLLEPSPESDFHPDALAFHSQMAEANNRILYAGAEVKPEHKG